MDTIEIKKPTIEVEDPTDEALLDYWTNAGDREAHEIRSHRAPRTTVARRAPLLLALAFLVGLLGAGGLAQRNKSQIAAWAEGNPQDVIALADLPQTTTFEDPVPQRAEAPRASRSQRRAVSPSGPRWVAPLLGKLRTTACFGENRGDHRHGGLDLDGETGDLVRSVGSGRVVQVGYRFSGAGLTVTVQHGDTLVLYAHLSRTSVLVGAAVVAKQKLGEVGSTGNSTGSHLHFGVAKTTTLGKLWERLINPVPWLEARGISIAGC